MSSRRRVVVTGLGAVTSIGSTVSEFWKNLLAGQSGVRKITQFDAAAFACQIAAEVRDFDPLQFIEKKEIKKMGRFIQFAIAAAASASCSKPTRPASGSSWGAAHPG